MAKLTQSAIKEKADEWGRICKKIDKAEESKATELAPFIKKFEVGTQAIHDHHDPKIQKLKDARLAIERDVLNWLSEQGKVIRISGELAEAVNQTKEMPRVVEPETFFKKVQERTGAFWE